MINDHCMNFSFLISWQIVTRFFSKNERFCSLYLYSFLKRQNFSLPLFSYMRHRNEQILPYNTNLKIVKNARSKNLACTFTHFFGSCFLQTGLVKGGSEKSKLGQLEGKSSESKSSKSNIYFLYIQVDFLIFLKGKS